MVGLGALVQGTTGFGFALFAAPALLLATSPSQSVSGIALLSLIVIAPTLLARPQIVRSEATGIGMWALPGLIGGVVILHVAPDLVLRVLLASGLLLAVTLRLRHGAGPAPTSTALTGVIVGTLTTTIGVNGPPMVVHLLRRGLTPAQMRGTLSIVFLGLDLLGLVTLAVAGSLHLPPDLGWLMLVTACGSAVGQPLAARLDGEVFERVVLGLLVLAAVVTLVG